MIYTVEFQKTGATFNSGEQANADRIQGLAPSVLNQYQSIDASLIFQGVLASEETYSWDQETHTLTVTRDISNIDQYFAAKDEVSSKIFETVTANGWTRTKQMIPA
jgi:hypothetical protein